LECSGGRNTDAVVALFDVESPAPLQYWTVRDGFGGTLLFTPPSPQTSAPSGDESKVTDVVHSKSKLIFISCLREFVVFDPYQREDEPDQPVVRDVSLPEEASSGFTAVYGKAVEPRKSDAPAEVLSALSRAPWGTLLNGPSHVLPSLSVVCIPFMDSLLKKRTEQT
jgi:NET1-associated nuclear protein 1 (U3 small nucleolar RNA-associated protein 17)